MISYEYPHEYQYALYLSYEFDLSLFDPLICNMVSERYLAYAFDYDEDGDSNCEEDASDSLPQQEPSLSDVLESATTEKNDQHEFVFGSFGNSGHSDLDTIPSATVNPIKPEIKGSAIKIGEITCFLVNGGSANNDVLLDPEVKVDEKSDMVINTVKELNADLFKKVEWMNLVLYGFLAFDLRHVDFNFADSDHIISSAPPDLHKESEALRILISKGFEPIGALTFEDGAHAAFDSARRLRNLLYGDATGKVQPPIREVHGSDSGDPPWTSSLLQFPSPLLSPGSSSCLPWVPWDAEGYGFKSFGGSDYGAAEHGGEIVEHNTSITPMQHSRLVFKPDRYRHLVACDDIFCLENWIRDTIRVACVASPTAFTHTSTNMLSTSPMSLIFLSLIL